ncbi:MAG: hypothetical protein CL458_09300 [Acidimicrobiaceae bacterium]|nr:hypothetical protein [Acidimicrobiaceae bacterium]
MLPKRNYSFRLPKKASLGLRLIASSAMLTLLLTQFPADDLQARWPEWEPASWLWLGASLALTLGAFALASVRWLEVCKTLGETLNFSQVFSYFLAGQFIGNFLPTTVGGDILRVTRMGNQTSNHSRAFASVIIERSTGWLVLPVITLFTLMMKPDLLSGRRGIVAFTGSIATLVLLSLLIFMAQHPNFGGRLKGQNGLTASLAAVHQGLAIYRKVPGSMFRLLAVSVAFQACLIFAVICVANSIGIRLDMSTWFAFLPMVFVAQVLPIAIGGLGVREAALVFFLGSSYVASSQSVVLGLLTYAVTLIASLAGVLPFIFGPRHQNARGEL